MAPSSHCHDNAYPVAVEADSEIEGAAAMRPLPYVWPHAVLAAASFAGYVYRIGVEERTLLAVVGEPYREFMRTRKRLIPFIY